MQALLDQLTQNEIRIFRAVYEKGPISRARLAEGLGLTRAAITINMKKLTRLNLIYEVGKGEAGQRRGRREVLLTTNPEAGIILSVHISLGQINYGLVNLAGKILKKKSHFFNEPIKPSKMLDFVIDDLKKMLSASDDLPDSIFAISVAAPGIINYKTGIIQEKSHRGWTGFNVKKYFEDRFDQVTIIENDVKTLTLGEYHFGTGRKVNDVVCLWIKHGIGAGIIHDGRLIRGFNGCAGEIGFSEFILDAPYKKSILTSHKPKYWGDVLSFTNIQETIERGIKDNWKTSLAKSATIEDFAKAVTDGDPLATYIVRLYAEALSRVCCNLIYAYNPKMFVLSGPLIELVPNLASEIKHNLEKGTMRTPLDQLDIKSSILGEDGMLSGGAAIHLEDLFKASENTVMSYY